jgi:hypothetical protein
MGFVSPYTDKPKSNSTKQKLQTGTISKVLNENFSKEDLEILWKKHDELLQNFDNDPTSEKYTRTVSELIKNLRDVDETLIEAGAIPGHEKKDVASYVWKELKDRNINYSKGSFYRYFSSEQKRDWQTEEFFNKKINTKHEHDWLVIGETDLGLMKKCRGSSDSLCGAIMIDGKIYEYIPEEPQEPDDPKNKKKQPPINEKCWPIIESFQNAANNLYDFAGLLKKNTHLLTEEEIKKTREAIFQMNKAGEFLTKSAMNKKQLIDPYTMHLLEIAYGNATQNVAGGLFIMYRLDLAERRHSEGIKTFKDMGEFAKLISEKQTKKAMEGKIKEINPRYEPVSEKDAQDRGFTGQRCEKCSCLRVGFERIKNSDYDEEKDPVYMKYKTSLFCFGCYHIPEKKIFKLPKQMSSISTEWESQ